jgi:hypothetical protein
MSRGRNLEEPLPGATLLATSIGMGTLLTLDHEQFFDQAARDGHEGGWISTLDKLEQYFG